MPKHKEKSPLLIGVDLGGTNVRAGLVQIGRIISLHKQAISSHAEQKIVLEEIYQTIAAVLQPNVTAIGIGVPSLVKDVVVYHRGEHPLPGAKSRSKSSWKKAVSTFPAYASITDAKCFALGELHYGRGRGRKNLRGLDHRHRHGLRRGHQRPAVHRRERRRGRNRPCALTKADEFEHYCSGRFFKREFGLGRRGNPRPVPTPAISKPPKCSRPSATIWPTPSWP